MMVFIMIAFDNDPPKNAMHTFSQLIAQKPFTETDLLCVSISFPAS